MVAALFPAAGRAQMEEDQKTEAPPSMLAPRAGSGSAPAAAPTVPSLAAPSEPPRPTELWLGSLQLVLAYAAEIGAGYGAAALPLDSHRLTGDSDYGVLVLATAILPAVAGGTVGAVGYASRHYRGRWWATLLGSYAGAAVGALLGMAMAGKPGPDDTEAFVRTMTGLIGVVALTPVGALIGYHAGKLPIAPPARSADVDSPPAPVPPSDRQVLLSAASEVPHGPSADQPARRLVLPVLNVTW